MKQSAFLHIASFILALCLYLPASKAQSDSASVFPADTALLSIPDTTLLSIPDTTASIDCDTTYITDTLSAIGIDTVFSWSTRTSEKDSVYVIPFSQWCLPIIFNAYPFDFHALYRSTPHNPAAIIPSSWDSCLSYSSQAYIDSLRRATLRYASCQHINIAKYNAITLPKPGKVAVHIDMAPHDNWKTLPTHNIEIQIPTSEIPRNKDYKYTYWKFIGRFSAQISQTYISPNWSSGGTTNNSALLSVYMTLKYDDKKLIQFDNVFDLQLGLNSNESDTIRHFSVGTDQLHISSKLGVKAFSNWYYSLQAELITQMADNYKANTNTLKSSFLSPAKLFMSLGLDYKYTGKDKNLSVLLTPLTYKLNYVREIDKIDPKNYGIEEGKHYGHELGIKFSTTFNWAITDNIAWSTYFYYYSNFGYIDSEWKNTFNFTINRFFTAQVFLHTKYDDRIEIKEGQKTRFQFKDILSIGFTYYFPSFRFI